VIDADYDALIGSPADPSQESVVKDAILIAFADAGVPVQDIDVIALAQGSIVAFIFCKTGATVEIINEAVRNGFVVVMLDSTSYVARLGIRGTHACIHIHIPIYLNVNLILQTLRPPHDIHDLHIAQVTCPCLFSHYWYFFWTSFLLFYLQAVVSPAVTPSTKDSSMLVLTCTFFFFLFLSSSSSSFLMFDSF
jgi:hypothetical protein